MARIYKKNKNMLKILILTPALVRQGPINVTLNMLKAAKRNNTEMDFRILTISNEGAESRLNEFKEIGIPVDTMGFPSGYYVFFHMKEVKKKIEEIRPDILHSMCFRADILASFLKLPRLIKMSSLWNYPYDDYMDLFGKYKGTLIAWFHIRQYRRFNTVVVCSNFIADRLRDKGIPQGIVYTGVDTNFFSPYDKESRDRDRSKLGIKPNDKVFIFIANMIVRKNPTTLIQAFLNYHNDDAKLLIMGDGLLFDECKNLARNDNRIIFLGRKSSTLDDLRISDFYVSPSYSEGFSTAVLEAASVGLKPILSNIKPHLELIHIDPNHLAFDPDSVEELTECLVKAVEGYNSFNYRDLVINHFSDNSMYFNYREIYKYQSGNIYIK